jgi:hypothetical protein
MSSQTCRARYSMSLALLFCCFDCCLLVCGEGSWRIAKLLSSTVQRLVETMHIFSMLSFD